MGWAVSEDRMKAFWAFVYVRQQVFERRLLGEPAPWSLDAALNKYRFCNVYRASDRVSQYLIRDVLYQGVQEPEELVFRAILFRVFNKIETWRLWGSELGESSGPRLSTFNADRYIQIADHARAAGRVLWTGAYIVRQPAEGHQAEDGAKHKGWLNILGKWQRTGFFRELAELRTRAGVFSALRTQPYVGDFMAMQFTTDIGYANLPLLNASREDSFVIAGPGACKGAAILAPTAKPLEVISQLHAAQIGAFQQLRVPFAYLEVAPGVRRRLSKMDLQNCLCEWSKYCRVVYPQWVGGENFAQHLRQRFDPAGATEHAPIEYWYPPKWVQEGF